MFFIGQEVECIDPTWGCSTGSRHQMRFCPNLPVMNGIYHIRTCGPSVVIQGRLHCMVLLVEVVNPIVSPPQQCEPWFSAFKYRPVWRVTKNAHVEDMIKLYSTVKVGEDA